MAGVQGSSLALAVSNAGGVGSLPCATLDPETLRTELVTLEAGTDKPYNVNFFCHNPPVRNMAQEAAWLEVLAPYFHEFGMEKANIPTNIPIAPINSEMLEVLRGFSPAIVSFHFGLPAEDVLECVRSIGAKIIATATTVEEALVLEAGGVDAVIAQGVEAGGHRGVFLDADLTRQAGTLALLPQVLNAVKIPVIAAGGIADARGVAAAMALGAAAVQVGTAYLLCPETTLNPHYRAMLKSPAARHTAITNVFTGRPARAIVNRLVRELGPVCPQAPEFPLAMAAVSALRAGLPGEAVRDFSAFWCGQNASGCKEIPAAKMTRDLTSLL